MTRIVFILFLLIGLNLHAQPNPFGIKVGGNIANIVGDGTSNISSLINFQAGFYKEFNFGKVAFQPELLFNGFGLEADDQGNVSEVALNYLTLSVLSKIFLSKKFSLDAGPQVGILLSANDRNDIISNEKSLFYNRDFGVNLGMGYAFSQRIIASFLYYIGLTDVTTASTKNYNRAFQLALQFKIK